MNQLVVLGAGKPIEQEEHSALKPTSGSIKTLDWLLHSVACLQARVTFVAGFKQQEITENYPQFEYVVNPDWDKTGASASFLLANQNLDDACFATYGDILFRDYVAERLRSSEADITVVVDSNWRNRYRGRTKRDLLRCEKVCVVGQSITRLGEDIPIDTADAEFVGIVRFSRNVNHYLRTHATNIPPHIFERHLATLIEYLRLRGFNVKALDIKGDWAELNEHADLARFILGTKAQTLQRLQGLVCNSIIEDQISFTVAEWASDQGLWTNQIQHTFKPEPVVVRSSALSEDSFGNSQAGAYASVLSVDSNTESTLSTAIETVIASYPDQNPANQVLIQPMVKGVLASGVVFTRTLTHGAPYYVINYDDITQDTESITSGTSRTHKTVLIHRGYSNPKLAEPIGKLMPAVWEIESLLDFDSLDIEFAVSASGNIHILQVRPIAVSHSLTRNDEQQIEEALHHAKEHFQAQQKNSPFVAGQSTIFGIMPDWNPAEIIGTKPRRLALSLYQHLIMNETWATQRAEMGYRDIRPQPLLTTFAGHPYIDIRASFNSFIPATLDDDLASRLVSFYLRWLEQHPHLHDKVEFDVVPTCYALDFQRWRARLYNHGQFTAEEIQQLEDGLIDITQQAIKRISTDLSSITKLEERFEQINQADLPPLQKAHILLEDCKRYGTLPFAHLARSAFIAVTLLRSAVNREIISNAAMSEFMGSIRTITHQFTDDAYDTAHEILAWETFVQRYGHLRPGTYDITSTCYQDDPDHYLAPTLEQIKEKNIQPERKYWGKERSKLINALIDNGLCDSDTNIEAFLHQAIEGRERAKFAFTRNLSAALEQLVIHGQSQGLSREELSYIPIDELLKLQLDSQLTPSASRKQIKETVKIKKKAHQLTKWIELPPLITGLSDFRIFTYPSSQANFIGSKKITAQCIDIQSTKTKNQLNSAGKIVLIPQADPGFDWLFAQNIAGLITIYGGANSHMAIRAAEFDLPAAIGIGEAQYARLSGANMLLLDPANRRIEVIK